MTKTKGVLNNKECPDKHSLTLEIPASPGTVLPPSSLPPLSPNEINQRSVTLWYVLSILASFLCCFPCAAIGMLHAMIAKHEGERANVPAYHKRLYQAKCWTSWSIILGLVCFLTFLALIAWFLNATYWEYDEWSTVSPIKLPEELDKLTTRPQ